MQSQEQLVAKLAKLTAPVKINTTSAEIVTFGLFTFAVNQFINLMADKQVERDEDETPFSLNAKKMVIVNKEIDSKLIPTLNQAIGEKQLYVFSKQEGKYVVPKKATNDNHYTISFEMMDKTIEKCSLHNLFSQEDVEEALSA